MSVLELPDAPGYGRGIHWVGATDPGAVGPLEVWFDPTGAGTLRVRNLANTAWLTVGSAGATLARGVVGVGIAWTASGTAIPGTQANTDLDQNAIDTVFLDVGGVASAPHGLTDGFLLAPVAGNYIARADFGGFDAGHANAGPVQIEVCFSVNGSPLGMAELLSQVPSLAADYNVGGVFEQPLTLAALDVVNVNAKYSNSTGGASMTAWLYAFELEQIS
jgi:hypothetical protein